MARAFAEIAFTDSVKAAQSRYGTRKADTGFEFDQERRDRLNEDEIAFLAERDSFYMGSVGENGWPYVQHRGGPKGFLKVLDEKTIGFADFKGISGGGTKKRQGRDVATAKERWKEYKERRSQEK